MTTNLNEMKQVDIDIREYRAQFGLKLMALSDLAG